MSRVYIVFCRLKWSVFSHQLSEKSLKSHQTHETGYKLTTVNCVTPESVAQVDGLFELASYVHKFFGDVFNV